MQCNIEQYWKQDIPDSHLLSIIGEMPKRWGRMDPASRIAVVEIGLLLKQNNLLSQSNILSEETKVGLIVGTKLGSVTTDLSFCQSLSEGVENASPILFSYTLPNIPLAEAACHYKITGPVYSIISEEPLNEAIRDAQNWLKNDSNISLIIAGEIDFPKILNNESLLKISATFRVIKWNHA